MLPKICLKLKILPQIENFANNQKSCKKVKILPQVENFGKKNYLSLRMLYNFRMQP